MSRTKPNLRQVSPTHPEVPETVPQTPEERLRALWKKLPPGGRREAPHAERPKLLSFKECLATPAFSFELSTPWARTLARNIHETSLSGLAHDVNWDHVSDYVRARAGAALARLIPASGLGRLYACAAALFVLLLSAAVLAQEPNKESAYSRAATPERYAVRNHFGGRIGTVERLPDGRLAVRNSFGGRIGTVDAPTKPKQ